MKKLILLALLISGLCAKAQELPQYTQYTFDESLVNPAVTGIESYIDAKAGYRSQWTGIQGSPKTAYFTIGFPLGREFTLNDYGQMLANADNPLGMLNDDNYRASREHSALGLSVVSDKTGLIDQTHFDATYAYHIRLSDYTNLSVGASVGVNNITLNTSEVTLTNPLDPAITSGANSQFKPEAAIGAWYYASRYFLGASVQQLLPQTLSFSNNPAYNTGKTYAQYFFTAGWRGYVNEQITLLPSIMVRPFEPGPLAYDLNLKMAFRDVFWISGAFRKNDAIAGSFGFNIGAFLSLGYAYDYTTSELNGYSNGTHEIMLNIFLNNNYNTTSPRHTW